MPSSTPSGNLDRSPGLRSDGTVLSARAASIERLKNDAALLAMGLASEDGRQTMGVVGATRSFRRRPAAAENFVAPTADFAAALLPMGLLGSKLSPGAITFTSRTAARGRTAP